MTERKTLKPARDGLIVRDPVSKNPLAPEGTEVVMSPYWRRRLKVGDAVIVEEKKTGRRVTSAATRTEGGDA